ncbi:MAG: histidinol-phosphate transaminase [Candidatus Jordarchaeaceae archaeon]
MKNEKLIRQIVLGFKPYQGEISPEELAKQLGVSKEDILPLHANENLFIEKEWILEKTREAISTLDFRSYPDPETVETREAIAEHFALESSEIVLGNGSDEVLDILTKVFIEPGNETIILEPTFGIYRFFTLLLNGKPQTVLLNEDFSPNVEAVLKSVTPKTRIIFLCSPNNPTGNQYPKEDIKRIIEESGCIVAVDEAYADFADYTLLKWINDYENLIVLRSFSKSFGIAGLRIGFAATNSELAEIIRKTVVPYNVNKLAQKMVVVLIESWDYLRQKILEVKKEREFLYNQLNKNESLKAYPSQANFLLLRVIKPHCTAKSLQNKLLSKGILVRDRSDLPLLNNCLRITLGPRKINQRLLDSIKEALSEEP